MPLTSKRQKLAKNARAHIHDSGSSSNTENLLLTPSNSPPIRGCPPKNTKDRKKPMDEELAEKDDHITELKAETSYSEERTRARKRIRRLERERDTKAQTNAATAACMQSVIETQNSTISSLSFDFATANARFHAYENDTHSTALTIALRRKQDLLNATRKHLYASEKQEKRAQLSYKTTKCAYDELRVWKPTESGEFTNVSRERVRNRRHRANLEFPMMPVSVSAYYSTYLPTSYVLQMDRPKKILKITEQLNVFKDLSRLLTEQARSRSK
ncbi:hypothetical protein B0H16DRAFT_1482823 [Mycena metata]|uniref:Uncharacterized protein n=1 Tax=Mycena metata TaxID=1033252 RepID=A0AAD7GRQ6_9AGAR|nr:hypothetical protein B0H16DRAFT_1482823 [Mycena metata]